MIRLSKPTYSVEISDDEKQQATTTRKEFAQMIDLLDASFEKLQKVKELLSQYNSSSDFKSIKDLFIRYKHKIVHSFNEFLDQLQLALEEMNNTISDTEMENIKNTIVEEVRELRDGVILITEALDTPESPDFIKIFSETFDKLDKRKISLVEIVNDHLFSHIDYDILGRIKLGCNRPHLSKKGIR